MTLLFQALLLLIASGAGLINQTRRAAKAGITLLLYWALLYISTQLGIAYFDGRWLSPYHLWCTIIFVVVTGMLLWHGGGPEVDSLLAARLLHKRLGYRFTGFLQFVFVVGILIGLFFLAPVSSSWTAFGALVVAWIGFEISGAQWNVKKWHRVLTSAMIIFAVLTVSAPFWRSFVLPLQQSVTGPLTSMYSQVTRATIATSDDGNPQNVIAGTMLLLTDSTPRINKWGILVISARPARDAQDWRFGFKLEPLQFPIADIQRTTSPEGIPANTLAIHPSSWFGDFTSGEVSLLLLVFAGVMLYAFSSKATASTSTTEHH